MRAEPLDGPGLALYPRGMTGINKGKLMDGRALAKRLREATRAKVEKIRAAAGVSPCLATVLVGGRMRDRSPAAMLASSASV